MIDTALTLTFVADFSYRRSYLGCSRRVTRKDSSPMATAIPAAAV